MKKFALILFVLMLSYTFYAQTEPKKDLKVGLVLSGGGAKGYAHIGVLKALEENEIEIDFIGGTSMGSIVGALYASGYSAKEIEKIVTDMRFDQYMEQEIERPDKPFFQKENDDKYAVKLPVVDNKITLPSGWSNGQNVMNQLSKYLQHVSKIEDFNQLPIPFLCIATDLEIGEQVLLNKGDLAQAIRASAAFPTVVKPVEIEGKWLVDGGLVNNFPIDEVKAMGADFIIGVDVSSNKLYDKKELQSVLKIMEQMVSYQMVNENITAKKQLADLYIHPLDETKYTTFSFDKALDIIQFGYETAQRQIEEILKLKEKENVKTKPHKTSPKLKDTFIIKSILFEGNKNYPYSYLIEKLQLRKKKNITFEALFKGINRLWATDNFTQILPKVEIVGDEGNIYIKLTENKVKNYLQIGAQYDDLFKSGIIINWTDKHLIFGNDMLSADAIIGENFRYNFNYLIDNGIHLSLGISSLLQSFEFDTEFDTKNTTFDENLNFENLKLSTITNRLNFQYVYQDNFAWNFGAEHQYLNIKNNSPNATIKNLENTQLGNIYTAIKYDTQNNRMFPTEGWKLSISGKWHLLSSSKIIAFNPFLQGKVSFGYAFSIAKKWTTSIDSEAGLIIGTNTNPYLDFHLGGANDNQLCQFIEFNGYPFAHFGNQSFLKSGLKTQYQWRKNHFIGLIANIAKVDENYLKDWDFFSNINSGYGIYYGIKSLAGPLQLSFSRSPELKKNIFSVKLGYWF